MTIASRKSITDRRVRMIAAASLVGGASSVISGLLLLRQDVANGRAFLGTCIAIALGGGMVYFNVARRALGLHPFQLHTGSPITWPSLIGFNLFFLSFMSILRGDSKAVAVVTTAITSVLAIAGMLAEGRQADLSR